MQVIKDPLGTKGARLTTHITIPSRYLVFMPDAGNVGVSQKIEDEAERTRLKEIVLSHGNGLAQGFIVRTAAEGAAAEALIADMEFLRKLWSSVRERAETAGPGGIVHEDLPLVLRVLRGLEAGADGFLTKDETVRNLADAIRTAAAGEPVVPPGRLVSLLSRLDPERSTGARSTLTTREVEVLALLARGLTTEAIADSLVLSRNTIRNHVQNAMTKLGAHSRLEAVSAAVRAGVLRFP